MISVTWLKGVIRLDISKYQKVLVLTLFFSLFIPLVTQSQTSILEQRISLSVQRATVYELLDQISNLTGYFFIYDSKILNSDNIIRGNFTDKPLVQILNEALNDNSLDYKIIENHILIYKKRAKPSVPNDARSDSLQYLSIRGKIFDLDTQKPLPFVSISIIDENIGTVTNYDGMFTLKIPYRYMGSSVKVSHLGYKNKEVPVKLLAEESVDIFLEVEYISIQEVIIRNIDALSIVKEAIQKRLDNYSSKPIYIKSFYREGVMKNNKYLNYSEAVIDIYKSSYNKDYENDQVKLLKSRKLINIDQNDTLILKIRSGLKSSMVLDIAKSIPDFLDPEYINNYFYKKNDIVTYNQRSAYAISFIQKDYIYEPLFKGILYIDMNSLAFIGAEFEINPDYIDNVTDLFISKRSRKYTVRPQKVFYTVNYKYWNNKYYINHVRGDLTFRVRKKSHLFYNNFTAFFELVSSQIDTLNVIRFDRNEVLKTNIILSDQNYTFDESFWENFNIITPEERLTQALSRINAKIEEIKSN